MKFPLVSRSRLESANLRIGLLESSLAKAGDDVERLKESLTSTRAESLTLIDKCSSYLRESSTARVELITAKEEIKGQQAEIARLTAAFEKLTADYNDLGKKIPAFRPKAVRWNGPDGARAAIERAAYAESAAGKREAAAKL